MTLAEYCDWLCEAGLGWLGWSEEQVLAADMNAIEVGLRGRVAMLQAIFGKADGAPRPPAPPKSARGAPITLTPHIFDTIVTPLVLGERAQKKS